MFCRRHRPLVVRVLPLLVSDNITIRRLVISLSYKNQQISIFASKNPSEKMLKIVQKKKKKQCPIFISKYTTNSLLANSGRNEHDKFLKTVRSASKSPGPNYYDSVPRYRTSINIKRIYECNFGRIICCSFR